MDYLSIAGTAGDTESLGPVTLSLPPLGVTEKGHFLSIHAGAKTAIGNRTRTDRSRSFLCSPAEFLHCCLPAVFSSRYILTII